MDNEEKTNEEPQKPDGFTPGIERMTEKLENIFSTAIQALQVAPKLESGGHKWMVLSKALGEIRHILGPCAIMPDACFHKLHEFVCQPPASGTGEFFTKKETLDFLVGNPPFGDVKDAATPLDPSVQTGGGVQREQGKFLHEQTRGCVHPLSHGDIAQVRRVWRDGIADGSEVAYETAFRQAA